MLRSVESRPRRLNGPEVWSGFGSQFITIYLIKSVPLLAYFHGFGSDPVPSVFGHSENGSDPVLILT